VVTQHRPLRVRLEERDGVAYAVWIQQTFRFLFSDGRTVDVISERDDSELREAVRLHYKAERIEGVATLPPPEPPATRKRVMKRGATAVPD
jgi:hypothetical protein